MTTSKPSSLHSIAAASRSVAEFSGHGQSLGAAGIRTASAHPENCEFLSHPGQSIAVSPGPHGFDSIMIGVAWEGLYTKDTTLLGRLLGKMQKIDVDIDLGCLYELKNGKRGALQAFGERFGSYDKSPYIILSEDERTGDKEGYDEYMLVNGRFWKDIKRMLIYIYIYDGAPNWSNIKPQIVVDVPGENDFHVTLDAYENTLRLCALAEIENIRGGLKLTNRTEYFPGHEEMDRAYGFGLAWADGKKGPMS